MSSCRATSFYLSPGVLLYFKDHTVAAVLPDGSWLEIKHRGDIARFKQEHALWDGTILCGPRQQGGLGELRSHIAADGSTVEVWNIDDRVIEGRRPENAAAYALHRWAVTGDTQAVGGVRQLIEVVAPGAPRSVRNALQEAALRGEHHAVDVVAAAWRAGLLRNPDQIVELLKHSRIPFRSVPDPRLEQLLRGVVATGRTVDAVVFISGMIDGSRMLDAGTGQLLARDTATSSVVLHVLALDGNYHTRKEVACNPNTPGDTLLLLAKDEDEEIRRGVAENPNTPAAVLEKLAKDEDEVIRRGVAENPNTPAAVLEKLAKDEDEEVLRYVARHSNTPAAAFLHLSQNAYIGSMEYVARNPNTPVSVLEQLTQDKNPWVRLRLAERLDIPVAILEQLAKVHWDTDVLAVVARNPVTPVHVLEQLANEQLNSSVLVRDEGVLASVAGNPNTPVAVLEKLAKRSMLGQGNRRDTRVYCAVAGNPATPVAVLEQLAKGSELGYTGEVQCAVAGNPNTPVPVLEQLSKVHGDKDVLASVAGNPNTPVPVLEQLSKDSAEQVRLAAAQNPNTPVAVPEQLQEYSGDVQRLPTVLRDDAGDWRRFHTDRYEHHAIKNGVPLELHTTSDLAYHELVRYGAPVVDYPDVIRAVSDVGRENISFRFSDDTLKLRHTFAESTVQVAESALTPRVISSPRALRENSNYMGNCTSGYERDIRRDESLIIALDDTSSASRDTLYNVEIQRGSGDRWDTIGEINSRFNKGVTDDEQLAIIDQLTKILGKT